MTASITATAIPNPAVASKSPVFTAAVFPDPPADTVRLVFPPDGTLVTFGVTLFFSGGSVTEGAGFLDGVREGVSGVTTADPFFVSLGTVATSYSHPFPEFKES